MSIISDATFAADLVRYYRNFSTVLQCKENEEKSLKRRIAAALCDVVSVARVTHLLVTAHSTAHRRQ